jgi:SAM-dependent methyltransferase
VRLFSSLIYFCSRLRQTSRHFAEAIASSGAKGGFNYLGHGFKATLSRLPNRRRDRSSAPSEFDKKWGTDTSGTLNHRELGVSLEKAVGITSYSPTDANHFHDLIGRLKINLSDYTFVDCGSGKGLVLLLASQYPFKHIVGIEFSPLLHDIAGANLRKNDPLSQRCFNIELVCQDATEYQFPEQPTVVYFYNPFREASVFEKVIDSLVLSLAVCSRDMIIIYMNPVFIKSLEATTAFQRTQEIRFSDKKEDWAVIFRSRSS